MEITLSQNKVAIIDDSDAVLVAGFKWFAADYHIGSFYAVTNIRRDGKRKMLALHRLLLELDFGDERIADHINGDSLDNRRCNLRIASRLENSRNKRLQKTSRTGLKGVRFDARVSRWYAQIRFEGKARHLGMFGSPTEAHAAYCQASKKYHGEFGRTA